MRYTSHFSLGLVGWRRAWTFYNTCTTAAERNPIHSLSNSDVGNRTTTLPQELDTTIHTPGGTGDSCFAFCPAAVTASGPATPIGMVSVRNCIHVYKDEVGYFPRKAVYALVFLALPAWPGRNGMHMAPRPSSPRHPSSRPRPLVMSRHPCVRPAETGVIRKFRVDAGYCPFEPFS